jgi:hypothetical protein
MVFCKGKFSSLQALQNLFNKYANCSGQVINASKSTIFAGGISQVRLNHIVNLIGFNVGSLPFNYLGVPIFKGKPKASFFYPMADKIKAKLSSWKASLLSIAGRTQLVKSVIHSMLMHSISVYAWPVSLLKSIETWARNFIWSGDISKRKLVTVSWKKVCMPYSEGGLGLRSLISLNEASNLKLCWELLHSDESWATILCSRVIIISGGKLVADSPTDKLRERYGNNATIKLSSDCPESELSSILSSISAISNISFEKEENSQFATATISIKDESEIRPEIAKAIIQKGFNLYELSLQRNSLEDVFHSLTTDSNEENTAKGGN